MERSPMHIEDWLDDLCVRFIINLPEEDLSSVARICFQVEEAQWFYEDFVRPLDPTLPSMSLRTFCLRIFQHCPLLAQFSVENHTKAFEEFLEYKTRIPVRGAIMLNKAMDSAVLVKGWKKGANWGFPGGKINKDEDDLDCAIREVYEETGLDVRGAGLVPAGNKPKYIELPIKNHQVRLYVFRDVPMDTNFQPQTRKEISKIQWYKLSELPAFRKKTGQDQDGAPAPGANKFYMVAPFMVPLRKWIGSQKRHDDRRGVSGHNAHLLPSIPVEEIVTEDETWAHQPAPAQSTPIAIDTLDGATRELQRLLKMQPVAQGVHVQPTGQDKGSALLSILQSRGPAPAAAAPFSNNMPRTPLELANTQAPQPRNPHHHNNQHLGPVNMHQVPPPFTITSSGSWAGSAHAHHPMPPPFAQAPHHQPQQQYGNVQAPIAQPQPLPFQNQNSTLMQQAFPEASATRQQQSAMPPDQYPPAQHQAMQPPMPHQMQPPVHQNKPSLTGQSMALLSAFKRDSAPQASIQSAVSNQNGRPADAVPQSRPPFPNAGAQALAGLFNGSAPAVPKQKSPMELGGTAIDQPQDHHRNALLGMFKTPGSEASPQLQPIDAAPPSASSQRGQDLLSLFQGPKKASGPVTQAAPAQPIQKDVRSSAGLSLDNLSLQSPNYQTSQPITNARGNFVSSSPSGQPQPMRILQRGQSLEEPTSNKQPHPPNFSNGSPYSQQAQPQQYPLANLPQGSQNRRADTSNDQKRQLLSLFDMQEQRSQQPAIPSPTSAGIAPRSRVSSLASGSGERRTSQTPISSADQTFLLDYLQNVTNSATRQ